jgi:hypothetical protein
LLASPDRLPGPLTVGPPEIQAIGNPSSRVTHMGAEGWGGGGADGMTYRLEKHVVYSIQQHYDTVPICFREFTNNILIYKVPFLFMDLFHAEHRVKIEYLNK